MKSPDLTASLLKPLADGIQLQNDPASTAQGLPRLAIDLPGVGKGLVYLYGAHLAQWHPATEEHPLLWISPNSLYEMGKPIRGGVPICFPWFGPNALDSSLPMHGLARLRLWSLTDATLSGDNTLRLTMRLTDDAETLKLWPHAFEAVLRLELGRHLEMQLQVTNRSNAPFFFEEALHTYYAVSDVRQISVTGLQGAAFIDRTQNQLRSQQPMEPIRFGGIFDRSFLNTSSTCEIHDPGWQRTLRIAKAHSLTSVVWNPAAERAAQLTDLGAENWSGFVCVETANAADNRLMLLPGATHRLSATVTVSH